MRQRIERSSTRAVPLLAALLTVLGANAARSGEVSINPGPSEAVRAPECGSPGEACTRISGYIRAGSEFSGPNAQRAGRLAPSPLLAGAGVVGGAGVSAPNPGMVFLRVSGDDSAH